MSGDIFDTCILCEAFEVTVKYGPEEVLSPLEIEFIHAIHSGFNTVAALVDLYQLGHRPTFDMVSGLWKADYIYVNLQDSTLHIKEGLEKLIRDKDLGALHRTEVRERTMLLMQELVTGAVLPIHSYASMSNPYHIVPQLVPFGSYRKVPASEFADIVLRQSLQRNGAGRTFKVLSAHLHPRANGGGGTSVSRRQLQLRMRLGMLHERPKVEIISPISIDGQVRRKLEEAVGAIVEERPDDPFSRQLLSRVASKHTTLPGGNGKELLEVLLDDLDRRVSGLWNVKPVDYTVRHRSLRYDAELVLEAYMRRRRGRAQVRLLRSPQETALEISVALQAANQIVLCSPGASWAGMEPYWGAIERAVASGGSLYLLWGESKQSVLDRQLERNLAALAQRHAGADRVHWCREGLGTNESFLVVDGKLAILATFGILDEPRGTPTMGLATRFQAHDRQRCEAIQALLERVRRNALDYAQAKALKLYEIAPGDEEAEEERKLLPAMPDEPGLIVAAAGPCGSHVYVEAWRAFIIELRTAIARLGDCVEVVFDGAHRQVFFEALADRPANLMIASRLISPDAISMDIVREVNACVHNNAAVSIVYRADRHKDGRTAARLSEFAGQGNRMHIRQLEVSGGTVATDRFALLSGFPLLGLPGFLLQDLGQRRLEAGILVHSANFAAEASQTLGHQLEKISVLVAAPDLHQETSTRLGSRDLRDLQTLMGDLNTALAVGSATSEQQKHKTVEQVLRRAAALALDDHRWDLFAEWSARISSPFGSRAVATLLAMAPDALDSIEVRNWRLWLVRDRWMQGRFAEGATLLAGIPTRSEAGVPSYDMAKAAAVAVSSVYGRDRSELLAEAMGDSGDIDVVVAWICIASLDLLIHGVPDAADVLMDLGARAPTPWAAWCGRVAGFWTLAGQAVPMIKFEARKQGMEAGDREEAARLRVLECIEGLAQTMRGFHFTLGRRSWNDLCGPDGCIGMIRKMADRQDIHAAADWVAQLDVSRASAESILVTSEDRVYAADPQGVRNRRIEGSRRVRSLAGLQKVIDASREWVACTREADGADASHHLESKARELGTDMQDLLKVIEADDRHAMLNLARPVYETMKKRLGILWTLS